MFVFPVKTSRATVPGRKGTKPNFVCTAADPYTVNVSRATVLDIFQLSLTLRFVRQRRLTLDFI